MPPDFFTAPASVGPSVVTLVLDSGPFAKFILLVLFVMSVVSWAIIYDRMRLFRRLRSGGRKLQAILSQKGLNVPADTVAQCMPSIEGALVLETQRYLEENGTPTDNGERLKTLLEGRATLEVEEMEKYLIFLATTASIAPFLGLLGTVWGIMSSFISMGAQGTASIEVVGPGIAEALSTTIAGLFAAITTLVGYNLLVRYVRRQETRIDLLISRIIAVAARRPMPTAAAAQPRREHEFEEKTTI